MSWAEWLPSAALSGISLASGWFIRDKTGAEARKANAEAKSLDWNRFEREIERLDRKIAEQAQEIADLKKDRIDSDLAADKRESENRSLKAELRRLKVRIQLLEDLFTRFSIDPNTPPDMLAQIEKLKHVP